MLMHYSHLSQAEAENTLCYVLDTLSEGVWDWNAVNGHVMRSPGWYRMLGFDPETVRGQLKEDVFTWEHLIHPEDYARVMAHFEDYVTGRSERYRIEYRCRTANGDYLWIQDSGQIVERDANGQVRRMVGAHTNIHPQKTAQLELQRQNRELHSSNLTLEKLVQQRTEELEALNRTLKQQIEQAEFQASHDVLTGLYNRRCFEEKLQQEISRVRRYFNPLSLILIDIDDFKIFNDRHGHAVGDLVLKDVADLLKQEIRDADILARWGGEEFVIILPETSCAHAADKAESLRQCIASTRFDNHEGITCSFGVTEFKPGDSADSLFSRTDRALYQAKDRQRNNVQIA